MVRNPRHSSTGGAAPQPGVNPGGGIVTSRRSRAGFVGPALTLAALAVMSPGIAGQDGAPLQDDAGVEVLATPDSLFFVKGRDYGTDA